MTICIVSPHLDDAILSCGVLIQRAIADGNRVIIANIFSKGTNSSQRQAEEKAAADVIGAETVFLDELDAPDRDPNFSSPDQIFFGRIESVSENFIEHLRDRLKKLFSDEGVQTAYFPLGAGNHIDHRIMHLVGRKMRNTNILFYEDRPYVVWPGVLNGRFNSLNVKADLPDVGADDMAETLGQFSYHNLIPKGAFNEKNLPKFQDMLNTPDNYGAQANVVETVKGTQDEIRKTYQALEKYDSQMPLIFPSYDVFVQESMAFEHFRSGAEVYTERFWSINA